MSSFFSSFYFVFPFTFLSKRTYFVCLFFRGSWDFILMNGNTVDFLLSSKISRSVTLINCLHNSISTIVVSNYVYRTHNQKVAYFCAFTTTLWKTISPPPQKKNKYIYINPWFISFLSIWLISKNNICQVERCATSDISGTYVIVRPFT